VRKNEIILNCITYFFCLLMPADGNIWRLLRNSTILLLCLQEYNNEFRQVQSTRHAFKTHYSAATCCYVKSSVVYRVKVYRINICNFSHITHACVNEGTNNIRLQSTWTKHLRKWETRKEMGEIKKDREQICSQTIGYKRTSRVLTCSKPYREHPEVP